MNNATKNAIDGIKGTTENETGPKKSKIVVPSKRMKAENDGDLKQLQLGRIGTNHTDDRSGPDKIAEGDLRTGDPRKVAERLSQRQISNFSTLHPPSSELNPAPP